MRDLNIIFVGDSMKSACIENLCPHSLPHSRMIRQDSLRTLSLVCLLSWACLTGFLVDEEFPAWNGETIVIVGCIKDVLAESDPSSISITLVFDSEELLLAIPAGMVIPDVGRLVVVSCHATGSGLMLDEMRTL